VRRDSAPYLVITDVIVALVYALTVRPVRQRFRDVLYIWDSIDEWVNWPRGVTRSNPIQIN
jgi:hypothetical protein